MSRWKASALHLLLSIMVVGGIALGALKLWFPYGLYHVADLDRIMLVMLGIDLTVGPLLTLVVYKQGKPSLRFDLTVIALCQVAFLAYGLHTLWQARPVFLVASNVRLNLVFANEIDLKDLANAGRPEWRNLSWLGPKLVGVKAPADSVQKSRLLSEFLSSGRDIESMPRFYVAYEEVAPSLLKSAIPVSVDGGEIAKGQKPSVVAVPILSRYGERQMLVDAVQAKPIRIAESKKK